MPANPLIRELLDASYDYRAHRSNIPDREKLPEYMQKLLPLKGYYPAIIVASDMLLDYAIQTPSERNIFMQAAKSNVKTVYERLAPRQNSNGNLGFQPRLNSRFGLQIKMFELERWDRALEDQHFTTPIDNYWQIWGLGIDLLKLHAASTDKNYAINAQLREYVPLMLGARAIAGLSDAPGWMGRTSLFREGHSPTIEDEGALYNWDLGVTLSTDSSSFISPELHVEVKTSSNPLERERYQRAGSIVLVAAELGFRDAYSIVHACVSEASAGSLLPGIREPRTIYSGDSLDHVTENVYASMLDQHPLAARLR